jgi:hypothetical protein
MKNSGQSDGDAAPIYGVKRRRHGLKTRPRSDAAEAWPSDIHSEWEKV